MEHFNFSMARYQ